MKYICSTNDPSDEKDVSRSRPPPLPLFREKREAHAGWRPPPPWQTCTENADMNPAADGVDVLSRSTPQSNPIPTLFSFMAAIITFLALLCPRI